MSTQTWSLKGIRGEEYVISERKQITNIWDLHIFCKQNPTIKSLFTLKNLQLPKAGIMKYYYGQLITWLKMFRMINKLKCVRVTKVSNILIDLARQWILYFINSLPSPSQKSSYWALRHTLSNSLLQSLVSRWWKK